MSYVKNLVDLIDVKKEYLVVDTETSGLKGEIVELTVIKYFTSTQDPIILFDSKIKPKNPIDPLSTKIHHITDSLVENNQTWPEIRNFILELTQGQIVLAYNALFDRKAFHRSDRAWGLGKFDWKKHSEWRCIMLAVGDLLSLDPKIKWFKLFIAAEMLGIPREDLTLHSSQGDTILAGRVMKFILDFFKGKVNIPLH